MFCRKPKTAKQALAIISEFLTSTKIKSAEQGNLWDVLTALRGPDCDIGSVIRNDVKDATTSVIRGHLFGNELQPGGASGPDSVEYLPIRRDLTLHFYNHFVSHARGAFDALGLKWYAINLNE